MPPGGRGGEILPGVALRGAPAAALALPRNSPSFHSACNEERGCAPWLFVDANQNQRT